MILHPTTENGCPFIFIVDQSMRAKNRKQARYPSSDDWIRKYGLFKQ